MHVCKPDLDFLSQQSASETSRKQDSIRYKGITDPRNGWGSSLF